MISLRKIFIDSAYSGINLQKSDGSFPAGHNGSWNVQETPVRNTCHWLMVSSKAYELTQDTIFKDSVERAGKYLLSSKARPLNYTYWIMRKEKWETNGIVGQAWVIEALISAWRVLKNDVYLKNAHRLVSIHSFNDKLSLWNVTDLKGNINKEHTTLNQQIWFTALAREVGKLMNCNKIIKYTDSSMNDILNFSKFNGDYIHMKINERIYLNKSLKDYLNLKYRYCYQKKFMNILSKGYISYSLYPLAILYKSDPNYHIWDIDQFKNIYIRSLYYMDSYVYKYCLDDNPYAFAYHPTGLEAAYILEAFAHLCKDIKWSIKDWIEKQINQHYDFTTKLMCKNTNDPNTLSARLYEITRINDMDIDLNIT